LAAAESIVKVPPAKLTNVLTSAVKTCFKELLCAYIEEPLFIEEAGTKVSRKTVTSVPIVRGTGERLTTDFRAKSEFDCSYDFQCSMISSS